MRKSGVLCFRREAADSAAPVRLRIAQGGLGGAPTKKRAQLAERRRADDEDGALFYRKGRAEAGGHAGAGEGIEQPAVRRESGGGEALDRRGAERRNEKRRRRAGIDGGEHAV